MTTISNDMKYATDNTDDINNTDDTHNIHGAAGSVHTPVAEHHPEKSPDSRQFPLSSQFPRSPRRKIAYALIALILLLGLITWLNRPECDSVSWVDASLSVKLAEGRNYLGLNADAQNLSMGIVSPGITVKRSLNIRHTEDAAIQVGMYGSLRQWASIEPESFFLPAGETQQVSVEIAVPRGAALGDYQGKVRVCIKEEAAEEA